MIARFINVGVFFLLFTITVGGLGLLHYKQVLKDVNSESESITLTVQESAQQVHDIATLFMQVLTQYYGNNFISDEEYATLMYNLVYVQAITTQAINTGDEQVYNVAKAILIEVERHMKDIDARFTQA